MEPVRSRPAGRPPVAPEVRKDLTVTIRVTTEEFEALRQLARDRGFDDLSKFTRSLWEQARQPRKGSATWGRRP